MFAAAHCSSALQYIPQLRVLRFPPANMFAAPGHNAVDEKRSYLVQESNASQRNCRIPLDTWSFRTKAGRTAQAYVFVVVTCAGFLRAHPL